MYLFKSYVHLFKGWVYLFKGCVHLFRVASDHRELHSSVSKVGKAIDRSFVADYDSTSREDVFATPHSQTMVNEIILQASNFFNDGTPYTGASFSIAFFSFIQQILLQGIVNARKPELSEIWISWFSCV